MEQGQSRGVGLCFARGVASGFLSAVKALFHSPYWQVVDVKCGAGKEAALTHSQLSWP